MTKHHVQFWRSMTLAALLLFAAGQLVEQSHFHDDADAICAICTHADGNTPILSTASKVVEVSLTTELSATARISAPRREARTAQRSRAPPFILS